MELPAIGTTVILCKREGAEPFDWNYNNAALTATESSAKIISHSQTLVLVQLDGIDIKCNIPKRFFTSKGSDLKANPPRISIPVGFNIAPVDEAETEYKNPLNIEQMGTSVVPTTKTTPLIFSKIIKVMKEIKAIGKNQTDAEKFFSFRGIDDIANGLHPLFQNNGIFMTTEVLSHQTNGVGKTIVSAKFSFFAEDGSSVSSTITGESLDKGEYGTAKALSVAQRIALTQMFLIPTDDREWLTQPQFQKALLRINAGEDLMEKLKEQYRIKTVHLNMMEEAAKKKSKK